MKIDFEKMERDSIPGFKGGEKIFAPKMYSDPGVKIMHGILEGGATVGMHTHEASSEIVYILSGSAKCLCDGEWENLKAGDCHYCPKGHSHSLQNASDNEELVFFAVVPELDRGE